VEVYTQFEQNLGSPLLNFQFWQYIIWGLAVRSMYLMPHQRLFDKKVKESVNKLEDEIAEINERYRTYYFPYLNFITRYMQTALTYYG